MTKADGSNFLVSGGASLTLPALASYTGSTNYATTLQATGAGSVLALPELASIAEPNACCSYTEVQALAGGDVELPVLTQVSGGPVQLEGDGAGSRLDVSALTSIAGDGDINHMSILQASNSGTVLDSDLSTINGVSLPVSSGTLSLPALTEAVGSDFLVSGGASLTLPALISYTGSTNYTTTLQATGAGSVLALPELASIAEPNACCSYTDVQALAGGDVELPALTQVSGGPVQLEGDGTGSQLNVSALSSFTGNGDINHPSILQVSDDGTVLDPGLSTINGVSLIGDSTGTFTLSASLGLSISGGTSTVQAGTLVDQGNLSVQAGATLNIEGALTVNGSGILSSAPGSTIEISGNLLGTTQNADDFNPQGTVELDSGTGTSNPPQELEAMSDGSRGRPGGFCQQFRLRDDQPDQRARRSSWWTSRTTQRSTSPEAVYANELIVPSGATLNLNNLHLYVRGDQISGTIVGGTVTVVPSGGSIALNTPTPGTLTPAGAVEDWTFYGTTGESITVQLNPGGGRLGAGTLAAARLGSGRAARSEQRCPCFGHKQQQRGGRDNQRLQSPRQPDIHDPGSGARRGGLQHRQLCALGLQRHAQRLSPDGQSDDHRHDLQRLRRRSV